MKRKTSTTTTPEPRICEWFLLCDHPAAGTVTHPILGEVPCCTRCAGKFDFTLNPAVL